MAATGVIHDRLENDLADVVKNLDLVSVTGKTGNIGQNVVIQNLLEKLHMRFPGVIITAQGMTEEDDGGSFEEDYVIYPVLLLIVDQARTAFQGVRPDYLAWRNIIAKKLRGLVNYPLLVNCPEVQVVNVRNMPILPDGIPAKEFVQSGLVALCSTTELRTRGGQGL